MKAKLLVFVTMFSVLMSLTAFASEITWEEAPGHHNLSVLLPETETTAKDTYQSYARGDILSTGTVQISNPGNGNIIVEIETYAHRNVDRIRHALYLDQWDDSLEDWKQVASWDLEIYKEEVENNELYYYATEITVTNQPADKYYRVRGLHAVELNDEIEACASETSGILITD